MSQLKFSKRLPPMTWEYIAAFFDGEGCLSVRRGNYRANSNDSMTVYLALYQKEGTKILDEIAKFLRRQGVTSIYRGKGNLQISSRHDVIFMLENMIPTMRVKRVFAIECYEYLCQVDRMIEKHGRFWHRLVGASVKVPVPARQR